MAAEITAGVSYNNYRKNALSIRESAAGILLGGKRRLWGLLPVTVTAAIHFDEMGGIPIKIKGRVDGGGEPRGRIEIGIPLAGTAITIGQDGQAMVRHRENLILPARPEELGEFAGMIRDVKYQLSAKKA